jgi:CBS domain-containing protein
MSIGLPSRSKPVLSVRKDFTVMRALRAMVERNVGATIIQEGETLIGIFTERDAVTRVLLKQLNAETTLIGEVMTTAPVTVREDTDRSTALRLMSDRHIRHLPVVDRDGRVVSMLSMRHLLRAEVNDLRQTVWELVAETAIDGPGG